MSTYRKKASMGAAFAKKGEDIHDGDLITLLNEGKPVEGTYGIQNVFLAKMKNGEEKSISLNQTSINNMVDAFGEEAKNWVGKTVKVWLIRQSVAGKLLLVLYISHPDSTIDADGTWQTPGEEDVVPGKLPKKDDVKVEDIPF